MDIDFILFELAGKRRIGMAKTSVEKTWPCVTDLFSGPDKNFGLVHHFRSRTVVNMSSERSLEHMVYVTSGVVKSIGSGIIGKII